METETPPKFYPKQIVNFTEDNGIIANGEILREMFLHPDVKDKHVCVVSVTGKCNQGKSFFLNFLLRYLKKYKIKKCVSEKWLDPEDGNISGFQLKDSNSKHDDGIWIWSEIFLMEVPSGEEVAVVLMDTESTVDISGKSQFIFPLSNLLSSVTIFNMKEKDQFDLEQVEYLEGFANMAMNNEAISCESPFQDLYVLIRDWPFKYEFEYGTNGGKKLLQTIDQSGVPIELKIQKNKILKHFDNVVCCLLPHPGEKVENNPSFKGDVHDIDDKFIEKVEQFVPSILSPENLVMKTINGRKARVSDLFYLTKTYCKYFSERVMPTFSTIIRATTEVEYQIYLNELLESYESSMSDFTTSEHFFEIDFLEECYIEEKQKILDHFDSKHITGDKRMRKMFKKQLKQAINNKYLELRRISREKQEEERKGEQIKQDELKQQLENLQKLYENKLNELESKLNQEKQKNDQANKANEERMSQNMLEMKTDQETKFNELELKIDELTNGQHNLEDQLKVEQTSLENLQHSCEDNLKKLESELNKEKHERCQTQETKFKELEVEIGELKKIQHNLEDQLKAEQFSLENLQHSYEENLKKLECELKKEKDKRCQAEKNKEKLLFDQKMKQKSLEMEATLKEESHKLTLSYAEDYNRRLKQEKRQVEDEKKQLIKAMTKLIEAADSATKEAEMARKCIENRNECVII